jgi:hypothetical protein
MQQNASIIFDDTIVQPIYEPAGPMLMDDTIVQPIYEPAGPMLVDDSTTIDPVTVLPGVKELPITTTETGGNFLTNNPLLTIGIAIFIIGFIASQKNS